VCKRELFCCITRIFFESKEASLCSHGLWNLFTITIIIILHYICFYKWYFCRTKKNRSLSPPPPNYTFSETFSVFLSLFMIPLLLVLNLFSHQILEKDFTKKKIVLRIKSCMFFLNEMDNFIFYVEFLDY
jgi:hypothetical protein